MSVYNLVKQPGPILGGYLYARGVPLAALVIVSALFAAQKEAGILITIGPTKDLTKVFGIYEAEDEATVRRLVEEDPYWQHGIWIEYSVKEWIQAV